jgi:hypothetical protein
MPNTTTLTITERVAKLGTKITTTANEKNTDAANSSVVPIVGMMLEEAELDALLGKGAHKAFFREATVAGVKQLEPRFPGLKEITLREKFVGDVVIDLDDIRVECDDEHVTIKSVKLAPQTGGLTAMSLKVECQPSAQESAAIAAQLNRECRAEVSFGGARKPASRKQIALPMGSHTQVDPDDADAPPATH